MPNLPYKTAAWDTHTKVSRRIEYPFPDRVTDFWVVFTYEGPLATYFPLPFGSVEPEYSVDKSIALYLCAQSALEPIGGGAVRYTRTWCTLPADRITYPSRNYITKPDYTPPSSANPYTQAAIAEGAATNYPDFSSLGDASYTAATGIFTSGDSKIYYPVKTLGAITLGYATAGTFTLTYKTSTTAALVYNAGYATIAAEFNALADVIADGLSLTSSLNILSSNLYGGALELYLSGATTSTPAVTLDATGLTVNTSKNPTTTIISTDHQQIRLPSHCTVTAHGLTTSLALAMVFPTAPSTMILPSGYWGSIDANTLWFPIWNNNLPAPQLVGTYSNTYTGPASTAYTGGVRFPRRRVTEKFYLPGVSSGVSTVADIPVPADLQNPDDFLAELLTVPSGYEVYRIEGPDVWLGPIYRVAIEELWFPDLV